ncbi:hypothetical protein ACEWY4_012848 [Coilia grayii]|uniref:V-set and transmembrane domain-containing protein 2-like protein n=1 Tax=Coilia grayii TaxID=363190 RepID=A0ABD1JUT0_9TELE
MSQALLCGRIDQRSPPPPPLLSSLPSPTALFTEVPHDIVTESGQDVEMACSFRGAGSPSVSLEIQWWYIRNHREWSEQAAWTSNQVIPMEEMVKDATKISVVKVAGSNISHKLRLSNVKTSDEGTYECRVIDFSDSHAQHHRVRAYLQVQPPGERKAHAAHNKHPQHEGMQDQLHQEDQHPHTHLHPHHGNQQPHHGDQHPHHGDQQPHHGDQQPHHDDHLSHKENHHAHTDGDQKQHHGDQKQHHGDQAHHGDRKQHHGDQQAHQDDQRLHAGNHHKKEEESKMQPAHNHQSEGKEMKRRSAEGASDCTSDDCGH